jgi:hypothetical protein
MFGEKEIIKKLDFQKNNLFHELNINIPEKESLTIGEVNNQILNINNSENVEKIPDKNLEVFILNEVKLFFFLKKGIFISKCLCTYKRTNKKK